MTRTVVQDTDASFVYAGTWSTTTDANASGGSYHASTAGASTCTITIPAGYTAFALLTVGNVAAGTDGFNVLVGATLDGVALGKSPTILKSDYRSTATWTGDARTSSATYNSPLYHVVSASIPINPATTHTLVLTRQAGWNLYVDGIELYVADAINLGRLTVFGGSEVTGAGLSSPTTQRFSALIASYLGLTEDNRGVASESLANGNPTTAAAGYTRAETGTDWWLRAPEFAVLFHTWRDRYLFLNVDIRDSLQYSAAAANLRYTELFARMFANSPATTIIHVTPTPDPATPTYNTAYYAGSYRPLWTDIINFGAAYGSAMGPVLSIDGNAIALGGGGQGPMYDAAGVLTADAHALLAENITNLLFNRRGANARVINTL